MAAKDDALRRLLEAHQATYKLTERSTLARAESIWRSSPGYRDADIARLVAKLIPVLQGSQLRVAQAEAQLVGKYLTVESGVKVAADKAPKSAITGTIYAWDEYLRQPALAVYQDLSRGVPFSTAVDRGAKVLGGLVQRAMGEARSAQAGYSYAGAGVESYNRVLSATACSFCRRVIGAGTRPYETSGGLRPLHTHCDCGYRPAPGSTVKPPGPADLARERNRAKAADLKRRKTEPAVKKEFQEASLAKAEDFAASTKARWPNIDSLPLAERRVARKQIGIADQRVLYARRALST
ncbi:hypothetical protein [Cryobacterium sp. PH31-O1]|uniref:hypothetical protein n=1 Tax=Cryobacterium sp. PH31-O1 TaxID=3046306 RepID=UPI0024B8A258|nr:hypothetical protein [Cryobacterium sp. PH31-O1]MDJ0338258.1 hypothetical protein [Cryobacterium sp. PH31-O1]